MANTAKFLEGAWQALKFAFQVLPAPLRLHFSTEIASWAERKRDEALAEMSGAPESADGMPPTYTTTGHHSGH